MANFEVFSEWQVKLPSVGYPVIIGRELLGNKEFLRRYVNSHQMLIVSNTVVAPLYLSHVQSAFADRQCDTIILEDGESFKNQQSLMQIYNKLAEKNHHRDTTVVALGGGVAGDISGFAASTWQRGVNFIQIPTTLLAQVDASVGGKTAINHALGKNMIGSFYQPKAVLMDLQTLHTLPPRECRAGFAEIIKYGLLSGESFLQQIDEFLKNPSWLGNMAGLAALINGCCRIKASFVEEDEKETGIRALLNLGHTFAHALEAVTHYKRWLHGEAVAIGLYCSALMSERYYGFDKKHLQKIDAMLAQAGLPRRIPSDIDLSELRRIMNQDKKIKNKRLRFVLIKNIGNCYLEENVDEIKLLDILQSSVDGEI